MVMAKEPKQTTDPYRTLISELIKGPRKRDCVLSLYMLAEWYKRALEKRQIQCRKNKSLLSAGPNCHRKRSTFVATLLVHQCSFPSPKHR